MATVPPCYQKFHVIQCYAKTLFKDEFDMDQSIFNGFESGCTEWLHEINMIYLCETFRLWEETAVTTETVTCLSERKQKCYNFFLAFIFYPLINKPLFPLTYHYVRAKKLFN